METLQAQAKNPKTIPHTRLMSFAYLLAVGVLAVFPFVSNAVIFEETFESYSVGGLNAQSDWDSYSSGGDPSVIDTDYYAGSKSMQTKSGAYFLREKRLGNSVTDHDTELFVKRISGNTAVLIGYGTSGGISCYSTLSYNDTGFTADIWHKINLITDIGVGMDLYIDDVYVKSDAHATCGVTSYDYFYLQSQNSTLNWEFDNINIQSIPPEYTNNIFLISPENGTTTTSTNVDLYIDYYNDGVFNTINWDGYYENNNFNSAFSTTTTASVGLIVGDTKNVDLESGSSILWRACLSSTASTTTSAICTDFQNFNVVSNPYPDLIGVDSWEDSFGLSTTTCSIGNIAGCFQNSIIFLFKPSQNSFDLIIGLKDDIMYKPPFGYFMVIKEAMTTLESTTTPAYTWDIPTPVADMLAPFKTGMAWILWVMFGFWTIRTFSKLQL